MAGYRPEYTRAEQQQIIDYICEQQDFLGLRGRRFWEDMEASGEFKRTWQSMKEHFKKKIFPNLYMYNMSPENRQKLKEGYTFTNVASKSIPKEKIFVHDVEL